VAGGGRSIGSRSGTRGWEVGGVAGNMGARVSGKERMAFGGLGRLKISWAGLFFGLFGYRYLIPELPVIISATVGSKPN